MVELELGETIVVEFDETVGLGVWDPEIVELEPGAVEVVALMEVAFEELDNDEEGIGVELEVPLGEMDVTFSTTASLSLQLV